MKKLLLIVLLAAILFTAGCTGGDQEPAVTPTLNIIHVTLSQTPAATPVPQVVYETATIAPVPTTTAAGTGQGSYRTYTSYEYKFSIQYPESWTATGEDASSPGLGEKYLVIFSDPAMESKQDISITPGTTGLSLDDWAGVFVTQIKNDPSVSVVGQYPMELDGVPAKKLVLTYGSGSDATESMLVMTINGDNAYFMEFTSRKDQYAVYSQEADAMVQTFRFL